MHRKPTPADERSEDADHAQHVLLGGIKTKRRVHLFDIEQNHANGDANARPNQRFIRNFFGMPIAIYRDENRRQSHDENRDGSRSKAQTRYDADVIKNVTRQSASKSHEPRARRISFYS